MKLTCELTSAAAFALLSTTVWAQTLTFSRADYATSDAPRGIAAADFNRDGAMDLALVNTGRKSVVVLMNETTQGRGFVQRYDIVLGGGPFEVAAADVNNDSVADLVVANADLNTIDVVLGRTAGGFEAPQHIAAAGFPRGVAVADLDWDGRQDIVYTQFDLDRAQILHGDATGQFTARVAAMPTGPRPQGVAIGEFIGCCRTDIAVSSTTTRVLSLFRQDGTTTFQRVDVVAPSALNVLTTGDFNRDGRMDIAGVSTASNNLVLFRDTGSGFGYYGVFTTGASPRGIEAVDLNKDGRLDLVAANRTASTLSVYVARADNPGWFAAPVTYAAANGSRDVIAGDFNLDGYADLATANEYGDSASVLINVVAAPAGPFWEARLLAGSESYSAFVEVGDFNGNNAPDVLRSSGVVLDDGTLVALNNGSATPRTLMAGGVGDVNADGRLDAVVIAMYYDGTYPQPIRAELYYGNGAGGFQFAGAFGSLGYVYDAKVADLNRDGHSDLVVVSVNRPGPGFKLEVLLASDTGFSVQPAVSLADYPFAVDVGDLDRNGTLDLLVAHGLNVDGVQVLTGDGTGAFSMGEFLATSGLRSRVYAVDVNRDGILDIVSGGDRAVVVWRGTSSGTFAPPQSYGGYSYELVVADLTGDGNPDLLSSSGLQRGAGNGSFSAPEPVNVWFHDAAPVDYDRDGRMDLVLVNYYQTMILFTRAARGPNLAPVAIAGPDYTIPYHAQFDEDDCGGAGPSFDPNLDRLTFEWLDRNGRIVDRGEVLCAPDLPAGTYTFRLVVRDAYGGESSDSKTVTVTPLKEAVVWASSGAPHGRWQWVQDSTSPDGNRLWDPDAGAPKLNAALASPTSYIDLWVLADPSQTYKLWVRLKAQNDSWANDSIFVQFEGGAQVGAQTRYAIGTTDALDINLEECSGCGLSGWGWRDERWGAARTSAPVLLRFPTAGYQRVRIQTREDGVSLDQFVLSAEQYLNAPPGPAKRDATIVPPRP